MIAALLLAALVSAPHRYKVEAGAGAAELRIEAMIVPGREGSVCVQKGYGPFVRDLLMGAEGRPLAMDGDCLPDGTCEANGCQLGYRFALAEAARSKRSRNRALEQDGVLLSPPGVWLLSPTSPRPGSRYRLEVKTPPEIRFVNGAFPEPKDPNAWEGLTADLMDGPYAGFGPFETARVESVKGIVDVAITPGERKVSKQAIESWVDAAAANVSGYLGRYPVPRALLIVLIGGRRGVGFGSSMGDGGASVMVSVSRECPQSELDKDWTLTHEMMHLLLPNVPRTHHWFEEGMATYAEPVARTRALRQTPEMLWRELMNGMPKGRDAAAARGLDGSGWASTYWGGALFMMLADVAIREQTNNKKGLEDALRGIRDEGTIADNWPLERVLRVGDTATGTRALQYLYATMGWKAHEVDLATLWKRLGVARDGDTVSFDEAAPLAAIRKAIDGSPAAIPRP